MNFSGNYHLSNPFDSDYNSEDVEVVHTVLGTITIAIHFIKYIILEVCVNFSGMYIYVCTTV